MAISLDHGSHDHNHSGDNHHSQNEVNICMEENVSSVNNKRDFRKSTEDINIRAALVHVIGDLVQSIGVLIASGIIWYNESWRVSDPICTLLFSLVVLVSTVFISRDILRILMEGEREQILRY